MPSQEIDPREVWARRASLVIVDVRRPDEFCGELGHVPGSQLIVLDTLPERLNELPKDKPLVFVCRSGARSGRATEFAVAEGYSQALNMTGGMILWNQLGLEIEKETEV